VKQQPADTVRSGNQARNWWPVVIVLALSLTGFLLRAGYSLPPLFGTWLANSAMQLVGEGQPTYFGSAYLGAWMGVAFFGLAASFWIRNFEVNSVGPSLRPYFILSNFLLPLVVMTAIPPFAWPLSSLVPHFVVAVLFVAIASVTFLATLLYRRVTQTGEGLYDSCRAVAWALLSFTILDWANLLLIGGS